MGRFGQSLALLGFFTLAGCGYFRALTPVAARGTPAPTTSPLVLEAVDDHPDDREASADGAGNVWIASASGVRCHLADGGLLQFSQALDGLTTDAVRTAAGGAPGQALVGFEAQGVPGSPNNPPQLNYLTLDPGSPGGLRVEPYSFGLTNEIIQANHAVYDPLRNQFWIGTNEGVSLFTAARDVLEHRHPVHPHGFSNGLALDPGGAVWDGDEFQLSRLNAGPSGADFSATFDPVLKPFPLTQQNLSSLALDRQGRVWAASLTQGLALVDPDALTTEIFSAASGLPSLSVAAVAVDPDGTVWVGTLDQGLARLTPNSTGPASWQRFDGASGLGSATVLDLFVDVSRIPRRLLITTSAGVAAYLGP